MPNLPADFPPSIVWRYEMSAFDRENYERAVATLFRRFEDEMGQRMEPGDRGRVGLKVYTGSGAGLATPRSLVSAVIQELELRGYAAEDLFIIDLSETRLRQTGFLPSISRRGEGPPRFNGVPVIALERGAHYDPTWYYDNPLPPRSEPRFSLDRDPDRHAQQIEEGRKSFLATPLLLDVDFWINMPVYSDHPSVGVNGALVNATLWNASNTFRFFRSRANAPAAVAEMAAVPELRSGWIMNLVSLELFQFIGGPFFNSLYTSSEPYLLMSPDPVVLDALMLEKINEERRKAGFRPLPDELPILYFSEQLRVGRSDPEEAELVPVHD